MKNSSKAEKDIIKHYREKRNYLKAQVVKLFSVYEIFDWFP